MCSLTYLHTPTNTQKLFFKSNKKEIKLPSEIFTGVRSVTNSPGLPSLFILFGYLRYQDSCTSNYDAFCTSYCVTTTHWHV